jgi:galactose mutarotase-like enzyme
MLTASPDWRVEAAGGRAIVARHAWDGARLKAFPFPHDVELAVTLAPEGLTVTTTVSATAEVDVPVAFGFHPYVALPPDDRAGARVALPVRRRQLVDDRGLPTGAHEDVEPVRGPLGEATYDDCFDRLEPGRPFVADGEHERLSVLPTSGYSVAQVFAPPGKPLVCFEPMVAPVDALVTGDGLAWARPGMPYVAVWSLGVVPR